MRLIDADTICEGMVEGWQTVLIKAQVDNAPTVDAVVVTRCKDCTHYDVGVCLKIYSDGNMHPEAWQGRRPDDFCSYGEREEGADG